MDEDAAYLALSLRNGEVVDPRTHGIEKLVDPVSMNVGNHACEFGLTGAVSIIHEADHTPSDRILALF